MSVNKLLYVGLVLLLFVPVIPVFAAPTGVAVLGDSSSEPYRCIGRGNTTSFNWAEILRAKRGIDFGTGTICQSYNEARSGNTVKNDMATQVGRVLADFPNIGKVIIMLGYNDVYNTTPIPTVASTIDIYSTQLQRLIDAGISPANILVVDVFQENQQATTTAWVNDFNSQLTTLAQQKGVAFVSTAAYKAELTRRRVNSTTTNYIVGGEVINMTSNCNEYHCHKLADFHLGTVANGIAVNMLMANFLGVTPLSDAEILSVATGTTAPTSTPVNTATSSMTPTLVLTPTPSLTSTITSTPTLTFTPSRTPTITPTFTFTPSNTPTRTLTPTFTFTPTRTPTQTLTPTFTFTPSRTPTRTITPTFTFTPTFTPTRTPTPTATTVPLSTPTPFITTITCPVGQHWVTVPIDARSVQITCVND